MQKYTQTHLKVLDRDVFIPSDICQYENNECLEKNKKIDLKKGGVEFKKPEIPDNYIRNKNNKVKSKIFHKITDIEGLIKSTSQLKSTNYISGFDITVRYKNDDLYFDKLLKSLNFDKKNYTIDEIEKLLGSNYDLNYNKDIIENPLSFYEFVKKDNSAFEKPESKNEELEKNGGKFKKYSNSNKFSNNSNLNNSNSNNSNSNKFSNNSKKPEIKDSEKKEIYRVLTPEYPVLIYQKYRNMLTRKTNHWGQRKLLLSEIEFMSLYFSKPASERKKNAIFIYAGAAGGDHIPYEMSLFPKLRFVLYDPKPFHSSLHELAKKKDAMVEIHNEYFLNDIAQTWNSKNYPDSDILFICDIRTIDKTSDETTEAEVKANMDWQMDWYYLIDPFMSMFKFRLPWNDKFTEYPKGEVFFQIYAPNSSSESRLIIFGPQQPMIKYDNKKYEEHFSYFSEIERKKTHFKSPLPTYMLEKAGMTDNFDSIAELYIIKQYLTIAGVAGAKSKIKIIDGEETINGNELINMSLEMSTKISKWKTLFIGMPLRVGEHKLIMYLRDIGKMPKSEKIPTRYEYNKFILNNKENAKLIKDNIEHIQKEYAIFDKMFHMKKNSHTRDSVYEIEEDDD